MMLQWFVAVMCYLGSTLVYFFFSGEGSPTKIYRKKKRYLTSLLEDLGVPGVSGSDPFSKDLRTAAQ